MNILLINGPSLNMLGRREVNIYGNATYDDLINYINEVAAKENLKVDIIQTNHEGVIVDKILDAIDKYNGIVINPAAYTHTSIAILDALKASNLKTVEVHLSNINEREEFRRISYVSLYASKTITGKGFAGYKEALLYLKKELTGE